MNGFGIFKNIKLRFGRSPIPDIDREGFSLYLLFRKLHKRMLLLPINIGTNASVVQTKTISAKRNLY